MASGDVHDQQSWNTTVQPSEYTEVHQRWNITDQLAEIEAMLATRDAQVAELQTRNAELEAENADLKAEVASLTEQNEALTEKLGRNSSNSHLPPSSDGPGASSRKGKSKRKSKTEESSSPRKRGGQMGHPGHHRQLQPHEQVDEFIDLFPDACNKCGAALPQIVDLAPRRYQMLELLAGRPHLTEFRRHEVRCPHCGHRTLAPYDAQTIPSSPFGPQLTSVVALLTGTYHLSRRRAQSLLRELLGIEISLGAISAMEARVSEALKPAVEQAQQQVDHADIKHADATSWARAGIAMSLWTISSAIATVYYIVADGCRETIRPLFGALVGILVSDRATVFDFWAMARRQICWAHLLRKFVSFSERDGPAGEIGHELLDYTALLFDYWHGFTDGTLTREELVAWMRPLEKHFEIALARAVVANIPRLSGSCANILAHRQALWTFVTNPGVEPTNNHAERELRAFVLWRKRSFGSQSERGERFAERVMTVVHTARKQGKDVLDFVVRCYTAHVQGSTPPSLFEPTTIG